VTKYRLKPSGDRITFSLVDGRRVALTRVARGTKHAVSQNIKQDMIGYKLVVKTWANSCRRNAFEKDILTIRRE
jgi:hypothetical protein